MRNKRKTVSFILDSLDINIPNELNKFNPTLNDNQLLLNYDKKKIKLKEIINILNTNKISFNEINTYESDLEDVFIDLVKK